MIYFGWPNTVLYESYMWYTDKFQSSRPHVDLDNLWLDPTKHFCMSRRVPKSMLSNEKVKKVFNRNVSFFSPWHEHDDPWEHIFRWKKFSSNKETWAGHTYLILTAGDTTSTSIPPPSPELDFPCHDSKKSNWRDKEHKSQNYSRIKIGMTTFLNLSTLKNKCS